jgi:hypothetical protein
MTYKAGVDTFDKVSGTQELQELSVVNFMAARGYEPLYDFNIGLAAFVQPRFASTGKRRVSVLSAIKMHNELAETTFENIRVEPNTSFQEYVIKNEDAIIDLFAGTTKIVKRVKLSFSKKLGVQVQSDKVEFMSKRDFQHYRFFIGV